MESRNPGELAALARRAVRILVVNEDQDEQQLLKLKLEERRWNLLRHCY